MLPGMEGDVGTGRGGHTTNRCPGSAGTYVARARRRTKVAAQLTASSLYYYVVEWVRMMFFFPKRDVFIGPVNAVLGPAHVRYAPTVSVLLLLPS